MARASSNVRKPTSKRAALRKALHELTAKYVQDVMALVAEHTEDRPATPAKSPATGRQRRKKRRIVDLSEEILRVLKSSDGLAARDLATALGTTPERLAWPLKRLRQEGRITKSGDRKGARYSLVRGDRAR